VFLCCLLILLCHCTVTFLTRSTLSAPLIAHFLRGRGGGGVKHDPQVKHVHYVWGGLRWPAERGGWGGGGGGGSVYVFPRISTSAFQQGRAGWLR
jgi:hypothetical protein